ncbi:MAG: enoyl-CoA hydratase/isomerase family protein [SAR202 cluster bacterium]|jgi:E-phenylitaconyl-CoA hydratase|nr:enoyl-CoA hydratase [Chloroflexota bacterium]MDP6420868.1 enoyl-CoA hydratase-related protein [SAR202 cluster bacterium]HAL47130.1 enoyl-CoA hydratase [Dehalococcoidia bacterium]MDP6663724.1 enoyl-CoA hydratase-related protein [SAR202 cluster bacterium]MDP6800272.1 enoyl-CoA hydratase-related protein [SAR202 cluster bacterium]|tara:strand:- start:9551 stop:10324 length:774 start_codon:yes stop_codon:yes gene_type:complete
MALIYEKKGKIAYITINRPDVMNAMDPETYSELSQAWIDVRDDPDVWCAIITGAGDRAFSAGADLRKTIPREPEKWNFWQTQQEQILNRGLEVWKPIIAAVNGYCLAGGMTLLLATDLRVAADHAKFGLSEVKRGILPGNGGTQRTIQQLPYPIAMWLLLSGDWLDASEAHQYGLVNKVVPLGELITEAERMAHVICENGPLAVRAIKELAVRGQYMPVEYGLRLEQAIGQVLRNTDDAREGPKAFAEKRKPNFTGR